MRKLATVFAAFLVTACTVGDETDVDVDADEDPTGALFDPSADPSTPSDTISYVAPSCMYIQSSWSGACGVRNWSVVSNCSGSYNVRIDIPDFPDTSCKYVRSGAQVTFTSGCGWGRQLVARSIQRC